MGGLGVFRCGHILVLIIEVMRVSEDEDAVEEVSPGGCAIVLGILAGVFLQ